MYIIKNIYKRIINFFNYKLKKFFYLHHFSQKKLDFNWEKTNDLRIKVINNLLNKTSEKKYLEIGCDLNQVFNKVNAKYKIGVDPLRGGNRRCTSDIFFKKNSEKFNVIFIDGLHEYNQIRKDVINSLKFLKNDGYIVIHDLIPRDWLEEHIPRLNSTWCGDVWKISFDLMKSKNIKFELLLIDFGLGIVRKKSSNVILYKSDFKNKDFNFFVKNYRRLPLVKISKTSKYI